MYYQVTSLLFLIQMIGLEFNSFDDEENQPIDNQFAEEIANKQIVSAYLNSIDSYWFELNSFNRLDLWNSTFDIIKNELGEILSKFDDDYIEAMQEFKSKEYSNFQTFRDYMINTNPTVKNLLKGNLARVKSIRSPRGETIKCRCGGTYHLLGTEFVCDTCHCKRSYDKKMPGSSHKQNMDKHIAKQVDVISGVKNLPSNIQVLKPFIVKWLLERNWLQEWLNDNNQLGQFCKTLKIDGDWFDREVDRIPRNKYTYSQYSAIINEFFSMFELCNSIYYLRQSDICALPDDEKINLCRRYYEQNHRLPTKDEIFEGHHIGTYILRLKIVYDKSPVEKEIENIFDGNLKVGGLMFNFIDVRKSISSPPKKFNLTSIYTEMMHVCFNVQYVNIIPNDKLAITEIIKEFNKYYKQKQEEQKSGKFNSPLFYCTLYCIITKLEYFAKYAEILSIIPDKYIASKAMSIICGIFILFIQDRNDIVGKYRYVSNDLDDELEMELNGL